MTVNVFIHTIQKSMLKVTAGSDIPVSQSMLNEYPERAFLLAKSNDFIILDHLPDQNYLDYLIEIGIGTRNILVPSTQGDSLSERVLKDKQLLKFLQSLNGVVLHPYMSTQAVRQIAQLINATVNGSSPNFTEEVNNKLFLVKFLKKIGVALPEYELANTMNVVKIARKLQKEYKNIIIIGEHTYAGLAVWPIKNQEDFEAFQSKITKCDNQAQFLIEKMYEVSYSPNVQYQISAETIKFLGMTDQILDNQLEHHGNSYPSLANQADKIKKDAKSIANALKLHGYRGLLGIDFIETTDGMVFAVDINGRVNASSFGLKVLSLDKQKYFIILTHLNIGRKISFIGLREFLGEKNIFDRQSGQGILPYNIGFLQWGKFSAIIIGNTEKECKAYLAYMKNEKKIY